MSLVNNLPRIVIAGAGSGVGKTTTVLALAIALQRRGLKVVSFKCGPDYLDPTYHERATGRTCHNLDSWMMGKEALLSTFSRGANGADIALIEGVMGVYDGLSADSNAGSTAEIAQWLDAPVLLTLDASGMARTFGALVEGIRSFDPALKVRGAIANFVGSEGHLRVLRSSLNDLPLIGGFPKTPENAFAERHLGLHAALEGMLPRERLAAWGDLCEKWFDLDRLIAISREVSAAPVGGELGVEALGKRALFCRIGIARDEAFHFYYEENLRLLEQAGAELVSFSPIRDECLPEVDGLYIGGGYPELHAAVLSSNRKMRESVKHFAEQGKPVYAECGGFMYLTDEIVCLDGQSFPMVGLVGGKARMRDRLQELGYVEVTTEEETLLGPAGIRFRGHQFRYSEFEPAQSPGALERVYRLRKRRGKETSEEGYAHRQVLASYVHGHWASHPQIAESFVRACRRTT